MHSEKARDCKSVARFLGEATSKSLIRYLCQSFEL